MISQDWQHCYIFALQHAHRDYSFLLFIFYRSPPTCIQLVCFLSILISVNYVCTVYVFALLRLFHTFRSLEGHETSFHYVGLALYLCRYSYLFVQEVIIWCVRRFTRSSWNSPSSGISPWGMYSFKWTTQNPRTRTTTSWVSWQRWLRGGS